MTASNHKKPHPWPTDRRDAEIQLFRQAPDDGELRHPLQVVLNQGR